MSPPAAPEPDMINARRLIGEIRRELLGNRNFDVMRWLDIPRPRD
jgi:hypothetical protein